MLTWTLWLPYSLLQGTAIAMALLGLLPQMGINAVLAHRVLRLLAAVEPGRMALRRAAVGLHIAAGGGGGAEALQGEPTALQAAQAAQVLANR